MKHIFSAVLAISVFTYICYSSPKGYITYSVQDGNLKVFELQLEGGTSRFVRGAGYVIYSLDAAPLLGNTQVIYESGGQPQDDGIKLLGRTGDVEIVVSQAAVFSPREPGISFDGMRLAYVSQNAGSAFEDILHVARITGEDDAIIYTTPSGKDCNIERPRFTPDGTSLVFEQRDLSTGTRECYHIPVLGGIAQKLEGLPANPREPALSPDGKLLACTVLTNAVDSLIIARSDGSDPVLVNLGGDKANFPAFSPDSAYVAVITQNGVSIINVKTYAVTRRINFSHTGAYGLCWHLGARKSAGVIAKMKVSHKSVSIKTANLVPSAAPSNGLALVDGIALQLDDPSLWINKKDKKFMYNDKTRKQKAKVVVKSGKGSVSAKKLQLTGGTDYRMEVPVPVGVNMGDESVAEIVTLDRKGKYKAPK
jgi:hypothetical protein